MREAQTAALKGKIGERIALFKKREHGFVRARGVLVNGLFQKGVGGAAANAAGQARPARHQPFGEHRAADSRGERDQRGGLRGHAGEGQNEQHAQKQRRADEQQIQCFAHEIHLIFIISLSITRKKSVYSVCAFSLFRV